jgi:glutamyl-tRNA synthetase
VDPEPKAAAKHLGPAIAPALADVRAELAAVPAWDLATIEGAFHRTLERQALKLGALAQPVRVAVTGGTVSPGIFEVLDVVGRERTLARIDAALERARRPSS